MSEGYCEVDFGDYSDDADPVEFYNSKLVKARKPHKCAECQETIAVGTTYRRSSYKWEGEMTTDHVCGPCDEASKAFDNRVCGSLWELFREEWSQGAHITACLSRLTTAAAKEHMRRQWLKWKGLQLAVDPLRGPQS